jgi:hypothetical protein
MKFGLATKKRANEAWVVVKSLRMGDACMQEAKDSWFHSRGSSLGMCVGAGAIVWREFTCMQVCNHVGELQQFGSGSSHVRPRLMFESVVMIESWLF